MNIILNTNPFVIPEIKKENNKLFITLGNDVRLEVDRNYLEHLKTSIEYFITQDISKEPCKE